MAEEDVVFHVSLEDGTQATQAKMKNSMRRTAAELTTAYENVGKQASMTGGLVSAKLGKAFASTNERTEKARQMLMLFGSAAGNAAGSAVYFGGTILYIVGQFERWQLAGMGAVAALVAIGAALNEMVAGPIRKANKEIQTQIDATKNLNKELDTYIQRQIDIRHGTTDYEKKMREARMRTRDLKKEIEDLKMVLGRDEKEAQGMVEMGILGSDAEEALKKLRVARMELVGVSYNMERLAKLAGSEALVKLRDALGIGGRLDETTQEVFLSFVPKPGKKKSSVKGGQSAYEWGEKYGQDIAAGIIKQLEEEKRINAEIDSIIDRDERERAKNQADALQKKHEALAEHNQVYLDAVRTFEEMQTAIEKENADRRAQIRISAAEYAAEQERKAQEDRLTYIEASINATQKMGSIVGDVADAVGVSSKKQMRIQAAFQAITDTLNAVHCFAQAAEYYAMPFGSGTAQGVAYTIAGAMYAASATLAAAKAGGAFGGGGGGRGASAGGGGYSGAQSDRYRGDRGPDRDRWDQGAQQTVIWNVDGSMFFGQDAAREITQLQEGYDSRQNPGRTESGF